MEPTQSSKRGFTLIELLVVVAIIVILVAILVPALNKALYLATLAACSANMDGFASSNILYAHGNKDSFLYRSAIDATFLKGGPSPVYLWYGGEMGALKFAQDNDDPNPEQSTGKYDDRAMWGTILDVKKSMLDPFAVPIDLLAKGPTSDSSSYDANDYVASSNDIAVGWNWAGEGKMQKLGSKISWTAPAGHVNAGQNFNWTLLMLDRDMQLYDALYTVAGPIDQLDNYETAYTSHPDVEGTMTEAPAENAADAESLDRTYWVSQYVKLEGPRDYTVGTSHVDNNYAHADGSVDQIKNISPGNGLNMGTNPARTFNNYSSADDRMVVVPQNRYNTPGNEFGYGTMLFPRR